jgi:magnesium transporter
MTFIAGVYGMNFDTQKSRWNMPELEWTLGYPFSLGLMAASSIGLLFYYRRMGWIGRKNDTYSRLMKVLDRPKRRLSRNAAASSR